MPNPLIMCASFSQEQGKYMGKQKKFMCWGDGTLGDNFLVTLKLTVSNRSSKKQE